MYDGIIDLNHNDALNLAQVQAAGITAIIHKATEGATVQDAKYRDRRDQAAGMGFLWGTYHFATNAPVADQVNNLLTWSQITKDDDDVLIALDFETNKTKSGNVITMSFAQAEEFVQRIHDQLGRWPVIYGGGDLLAVQAPQHPDTILVNCPLWYAFYTTTEGKLPAIPKPWTKFTLWQYTDGEVGTEPIKTPGATCDRNRFDGTSEQLAAAWPF